MVDATEKQVFHNEVLPEEISPQSLLIRDTLGFALVLAKKSGCQLNPYFH